MPNLKQCYIYKDWIVHLHDDYNKPFNLFCSLFVYHQCSKGVIHRTTYDTHFPHFQCLECKTQLPREEADHLLAVWKLNKRTSKP